MAYKLSHCFSNSQIAKSENGRLETLSKHKSFKKFKLLLT